MRIVTGSIVIGQLLLIGTLPVLAAQPVVADAQTQPGTDAAGGRATFTQHARSDMQGWQQKLHAFDEKAKAKGEQAGTAAGNDLNAAWTRTKEESRKLQTASAEDWASTKASYEKASHDLADAWDRHSP